METELEKKLDIIIQKLEEIKNTIENKEFDYTG